MRAWLGSLANGRWPEIALALAVGYAAVTLAQSAADVVTGVLAQHFGRNPFGEDGPELGIDPYLLSFDIGGTTIFYGQLFTAALALGVVALAARYVVRRRDRDLGTCPACAARIAPSSSHCAYCGSSIAAGSS
jgi:hypothetical protein